MLKEPEIKLFGRKIYLPDNGAAAAGGESSGDSSNESSSGSVDCDRCSELCRDEIREGVGERGDGDGGGDGDVEEKLEQGDEDQEAGELCETTPENLDKSQNANASSDSDENSKTPSNENDDQPKLENEQNGQQKTLKKPDKLLPCPRCNSMDTKFCYYNNYNVNQPRHFCKSCQRYWTAGGTMRNVPVGAGRRKNKNLTPSCRHITISEALQSERIIAPNGFQGLKFRPNGTVLSFGPDSKLCEPMESARSLTEKRVPNGVRNDDSVMQNGNGFPSPVPIPGVQWPFPWNSAVPFPPICPPGYPFPYYPAPVWGNAWNVPWLSLPSPTADQKRNISSPTSPLGKHSRKGDLLNPNRSQESSIVVPKTLRIDDPDEAAKSSIWSTLGIKYDSISREGLFKALQSKAADNKSVLNNSPLLQANPAAFSRSMSFQERA